MISRAAPLLTLQGEATAACFAGDCWRILPGQQWVVTGPNRSGKSLLGALLAGQAVVPGVVITPAPEIEERVALVSFESQRSETRHGWLQARWHSLDEHEADATVARLLSYESVNQINPFEIRPPELQARRRFARQQQEVLALFDLAHLLPQSLLQLSHGELQRALLVRALLQRPRLLILDDPFAGVDAAMSRRLHHTLDHLAQSGVTLVVMVRHRDEIPAAATHELQLRACRIVRRCKLPARRATAPESEMASAPRNTTILPPACGSQAAAKPAVATPSAVIELRALNLAFGNRTLFHDFNWRVLAGERWVILGPNGSGKTTLLSLISGDNPRAYAHDIRLFGRPRRVGENLWALRQRIGSLSPEMQRFLDPGLPLLQLVLSGRINRSGIVCRPVAAARQHALELLSRFGLRHEAATPCGALTDGQQRLGLIARALHARPRLLLLDEPCFNLDRESRHLVLTAITQLLQAEPALTAICVAHRPDDIPAGFDHLLRLGGEASGDSG